MPLHIGRVETDVEVTPPSGAAAPGGRTGPPSAADAELLEKVRPLVLEVLRQELDRLRRTQG